MPDTGSVQASNSILGMPSDQFAETTTLVRDIRRCLYRPFDARWVYYKREMIESFKPIAFNFSAEGNLALLATRQVTRSAFEHAFVSGYMGRDQGLFT